MIHRLVKVFSEQNYVDKFLRGELYARRLSWFKNLEDDNGRGDEFEAAIIPQLDNLTLTLQSKDAAAGVIEESIISKEEFASPPIIQPKCFDHVNVFCMFAAYSDEEYMKQLVLPEEYQKMGRYAVVITNPQKFVDRVMSAAHREEYRIWQGLVKYYDPEVGMPLSPLDIRIVFAKCQKYAHQKEFRFAIDTNTIGSDPITLDIDKLDDIAAPINTEDLIGKSH